MYNTRRVCTFLVYSTCNLEVCSVFFKLSFSVQKALAEYEVQWEGWRQQLLQKRDQMRKQHQEQRQQQQQQHQQQQQQQQPPPLPPPSGYQQAQQHQGFPLNRPLQHQPNILAPPPTVLVTKIMDRSDSP